MTIIPIDNPAQLPNVKLRPVSDPAQAQDCEVVYALTHKALKYVEFFIPVEDEKE